MLERRPDAALLALADEVFVQDHDRIGAKQREQRREQIEPAAELEERHEIGREHGRSERAEPQTGAEQPGAPGEPTDEQAAADPQPRSRRTVSARRTMKSCRRMLSITVARHSIAGRYASNGVTKVSPRPGALAPISTTLPSNQRPGGGRQELRNTHPLKAIGAPIVNHELCAIIRR